MKSIFLVTHSYERENRADEVKLIGVYATKADAQLAVTALARAAVLHCGAHLKHS